MEPQVVENPVDLDRSRSRIPAILLTLAVLAGVGAGGTYAWLNLDRIMARGETETAAAPAGDSATAALLRDMQQSVQRSDAAIDALMRKTEAQQSELRRMSEQVAALSARIDAAQTSGAGQPAAAILPPPTAPVAAPVVSNNARAQVVGQKQPAAAQKKRAPRPNGPAGPISVGGAPLPADR